VRHDFSKRQSLPRVKLEHVLQEISRLIGQEYVPVPELLYEPATHNQFESLIRAAGLVIWWEAS
jgi:hypothetical protein